MKQSAIQYKIIIVFFFAVVGILVAGGIAWDSLHKILGKIDELATPNPKVKLINSINNDIFRLNQAYRSNEFYNSEDGFLKQQELIKKIQCRIDSVKSLSVKDTMSNATLDNISKQLGEVEEGTLYLIQARQKNNVRAASSKIIKQLAMQLDSKKKPDSAFVIKRKTSEIRISNYALKQIDSLVNTSDVSEEKRMFSKLSQLFKRKKPKQEVISRAADSGAVKKVDTLIRSSVDSVNVFTNQSMIVELQDHLRELYKNEVTSIRNFNDVERGIQNKNAELLESINELLARVRKESQDKKNKTIEEAYVASGNFNQVLSYTICFFVGVGLLMLYLLSRDIRRMRYYQSQLEIEKEKATKIAKARQEFLATMSHEIRSPLTSIIGYSDLLDDTDEKPQIIKEMSEHLLMIVNEVLDIAKIEAGIFETHNEPLELAEFLRKKHLGFQLKIREKGLQDIVDISVPENLVVKADIYRLKQIIYNLIHNAIKFTDKGFVSFKAETIELSSDKIRLVLSIGDSGKGIAVNDQKRIFDEFQQAGSAADKRHGIGLGLGIVKKLVNLLGGEIILKSTPGIGSVFKLSFVFDVVAQGDFKRPHKVTANNNLSFKGKSLLLVDDDVWILKLNSIILESMGAFIIATESPSDALDAARNRTFDLAIIDLQMPEMNGFDLREKLAEIDPSLKIVAATANVLLPLEQMAKITKFTTVLHKPFHKVELVNLVADLLHIDLALKKETLTDIEDVVPVEIDDVSFDFSDFQKFTMGDEELLQEILQQFHQENEVELSKAHEHLDNKEYLALAEIIHKMVTRFGQIQAKQNVDQIRLTEVALRNKKDIQLEVVESILKNWDNINDAIGKFLKREV